MSHLADALAVLAIAVVAIWAPGAAAIKAASLLRPYLVRFDIAHPIDAAGPMRDL